MIKPNKFDMQVIVTILAPINRNIRETQFGVFVNKILSCVGYTLMCFQLTFRQDVNDK